MVVKDQCSEDARNQCLSWTPELSVCETRHIIYYAIVVVKSKFHEINVVTALQAYLFMYPDLIKEKSVLQCRFFVAFKAAGSASVSSLHVCV